jgi:hypothetical protein
MKYTQYFLYTQKRTNQSIIKKEWIEQAVQLPCKTEIQSDGRIRK